MCQQQITQGPLEMGNPAGNPAQITVPSAIEPFFTTTTTPLRM
jgi:hypothetical protein